MNDMNKKTIWNETPPDVGNADLMQSRQTRRKKGILRRLTALTLSAVLFGTVSAGTFYGVNQLLPQEVGAADSLGVGDSEAVLSSLASTTYSGVRYGMDVSDIAAAALPSVVAITNISVQEVNNFFKLIR